MTARGSDDITWYSYDLPKKIEKGTKTTEFWYGPDRARYRQELATSGTPDAVIRYAGTLFEFEDAATDTYRHYVQAGAAVIALVERVSTTNTKQFLHRDHQGSVVKVTNASGTVDQALAFDAWGLRRHASDWSPLGSPFAGSHETERGYTGHEHLDTVGLIHMNGRVQDPVLGRFISADPLIQAPYSTQSQNRYSYVWNNPTSKSDPSGFCAVAAGMQGMVEQCLQDMRNLYTAFTDHLMSLQEQAAAQEGLAWDQMEVLEQFVNFGYKARMAHLEYGVMAEEIMCHYGAGGSNCAEPATYSAQDVTAARLTQLTAQNETMDPTGEYVLTNLEDSRGIRAALWTNGDTAVIAIAGFNGLGDLLDLGRLLLGLDSPQLQAALAWARPIIDSGIFANMTVAGHSMGGAFAMGISSVTGTRAVVFDPIGLTDRAIRRIGGQRSNMNVTSYNVNQGVAGIANILTPASVGVSSTSVGNGWHPIAGFCRHMGCSP